jgi:hypothetical protein
VGLAFVLGGGDDTRADPTRRTEATAENGSTPDDTGAGPDSTGTSIDGTPDTISVDPGAGLSTRPADLDMTMVDSPWAPTPCPTDQEKVACIFAGIAVDEATGELTVPYFTEGFRPELEPAGDHLHFYLDTAVDGDERKAGVEVPGGSWRPWDGPFPFTSFGGDNGRTGFTLADVQAAGATWMCVLVSDAEQRAIKGSGNCAPIAQVFDLDAYRVQVERLTGTYIGACGLGVTMIVPEQWRWFDLIDQPLDQVAGSLRPTDREATQAALEQLVGIGGVLWADGPVVDGFIVNLNVILVESDVTTASSPAEVSAALAARGVNVAGAVERRVGGRDVAVQTFTQSSSTSTTYMIPDFGNTILVTVLRPPGIDATAENDAIAATVLGC